MIREGAWADHLVVVATAYMLQRDIMIITSAPGSTPEGSVVWVQPAQAAAVQPTPAPIYLGHEHENHYVPLIPLQVLGVRFFQLLKLVCPIPYQ